MELTGAKFKMTEVGLIPEDWAVKEIGQILSFGSGKDYKYLGTGEIPVYGTGGLMTHVDSFLYDGESVGIGRKGTIDKPIFLSGRFWTVDTLFYTYQFKDSLPKFVYYKFLQIKWKEFNEASGVPSLNKRTLEKISLSMPLQSEQKAIATALSDVDELIANLEKLIEKKKAIKQGSMQQLLTPKNDWKEFSILELADNRKDLFDDGDWIEAEHITDSGIRLIQTGNIGVGVFKDKDSRKYIYEESFNSLHCKMLNAGDILICRLAEPAGRVCIFPEIEDKKSITSVDVTIFRPIVGKVNRVFLINILSTSEWFKQVTERVGGTTHKRISRGSLGKLKIKLPDIEIQNASAIILSDIDSDINACEKSKWKMEKIKQGMMQELLTGRTRLI